VAARAPRKTVKSAVPTAAGSLPVYKAQLATLVDKPPSSEQWLHELKYDGYRIAAALSGGKVVLESRNGKDWTAAFPEVVAAVGKLAAKSALLDGEVAILTPEGRTSFQALQNAFSGASRRGLTYFAFDLLYLDGRDLRAEPLEVRKQALRGLVKKTGLVRYSDHVEGDGAAVLASACKLGAEGIVSKRRDRPYRGGRNDDWQKTKCTLRQEFVVGGFTEPEGSRVGIGALLLGYYDGGELVFAGKVGTGKGFTAPYLAKLRSDLDKLVQPKMPYAVRPPARFLKNVHWLRPERIAEVSFAEWTNEGSIRHPSLLGFRTDKKPTSITREKARHLHQGDRE
jgi:bifunctional non-homologous end joining protein LigD